MKLCKFITNPLIPVISFVFILISGESFGGVYLLYLSIALTHGGMHSITGFSGIAFLLLSYFMSLQGGKKSISIWFNLSGILLMWISLFLFFYNDKNNYNISTFFELVPQIFLVIFFSISICFIVDNILCLFRDQRNNSYKMNSYK